MRIALAANRSSGGGLDPQRLVAALRAAGAAGVELGGVEPAELERLAATRPDRLAVAGGDGTIGPAAAVAGGHGIPLAVIPAGTANDFARAHGLPTDLLEAARLAVTGTGTERAELGRLADRHPFVNVASAGLASVAAHRAQRLKPVLGPLAYAVGAVRAALSERALDCAVAVDGREAFAGRAWQVIVAVSGAFGAGAGVAEADPDDGVLDVVVIPGGSRLGLVRRAWGLRTRSIARQRSVEHVRASVVEVALPPGRTELNVDGELRPAGLERVTVEPGAFALVVPQE
jgi:diacylglycerol kinase family enzyme